MVQEIRLSVLDIDLDDETIQFQIKLGNGISSTILAFYGYSDCFKDFSFRLLTFPKTINDNVSFELGEIGERWAYYILLKVYCFEKNGYSTIQVIIHNNNQAPYYNKQEFFITTLPASINKLGRLLNSWNPLIKNKIRWESN